MLTSPFTEVAPFYYPMCKTENPMIPATIDRLDLYFSTLSCHAVLIANESALRRTPANIVLSKAGIYTYLPSGNDVIVSEQSDVYTSSLYAMNRSLVILFAAASSSHLVSVARAVTLVLHLRKCA